MKIETTRILLCEDERVTREMLSVMLDTSGARVTGFENPVLAMDYLKHNSVDLIITDIEMPKMNGLEFVSWLGSSPHKEVPVIVMSASSEEDLLERVSQVNCSFLEKPFGATELKNTILKQ